MLSQNLDFFLSTISQSGTQKALSALDGQTTSYGQLCDQFETTNAFFDQNFETPPRTLTVLEDSPSCAVFLATLCHVGTAIPCNPALTLKELSAIAETVEADAIAVTELSTDIEKLANQFDLSIIVMSHITDGHLSEYRLELVRKREQQARLISDDTCLILHTSGSTGLPKCVPISAPAINASAQNIIQTLNLTDQDVVVNMLPMFHIGAVLDLFTVPLMAGGHIRFAHPISSENLINNIKDAQATWFQAVPTMLKALLDQAKATPDFALSSRLRFIRSVSADLAPHIQTELENALGNVPVVQMYGMTETAGQITSNPPNLSRRKIGSVGQVMGPEVAILDRFGNRVPAGKEGEVCIKGKTVTKGYLNAPAAEAFVGDWFRTGDIGSLDEDGFLFLRGRNKDIVNRGGEKISCVEIEQCLYELDEIREACVFPIAHPSLGEDIGCAVVLTDNALITDEDIKTHLSKQLAAHKLPRRVTFLETLPRLGSGKIHKQALITEFSSQDTQTSSTAQVLTPLGKKIAAIWKKSLSVKTVSPDDDFFETGGDSLMAQTFMLELESLMGCSLPTNILYEAPTFKELEQALNDLAPIEQHINLPAGVYEAVKNLTISWPGARLHNHSLIVGQNSNGDKAPFFFVAADQINFTDLSAAFGHNRPFYAMRTLSGQPCETDANIATLAQHYCDEILELYPTGPIFLGGLCKGARIAFEIAQALILKGREPSLLVIIDYQLPKSYGGKAAICWSQTTDYSALSHFHEPEKGLSTLLPHGGWSLRLEEEHGLCTRGKAAQQLVSFLEPIMKGHDFEDYGNQMAKRAKTYKAHIKVKCPRLTSAGKDINAQITLKNISNDDWHPTAESNFRLLAKWQKMNGKLIDQIIGHVDLEQPLKAGESITLSMPVTYPDKRSSLYLYVDMVDDGVAWFGSAARRLLIRHPF